MPPAGAGGGHSQRQRRERVEQLRRPGGRVVGVPAGIAAAEAERERLGCRMPSYIKHLESELGLEGFMHRVKGHA